MKKLLGIAALVFAMSPMAQAQSTVSSALTNHPEARNDRPAEAMTTSTGMMHKHHMAKHHHHHHHHHAHAHAAK